MSAKKAEITTSETTEMSPETMSRVSKVNPDEYLSSGITLLNLAATNHADCFVKKGTYCLLVGESSAGKSYLATQLLAEAAANPSFDDYELIIDDCENGNLFDIEELFGSKLAHRLRAPEYDDAGVPVNSASVEDFFGHVDDLITSGKKFVYVLDSMDSLTSSVSDMRFEENKEKRQNDLAKGKFTSDLSMGYGDGKAKIISSDLRRVVRRLTDSDSILIIISQVRQNISGYGPKYVRSGGMALTFYCGVEVTILNAGDIKKRVGGKDRILGHKTKATITKNRNTGLKTSIEFPILLGTGISDIDSVIDWLASEGEILEPSRSNGLWEYPKCGLKMNKDALAMALEERLPEVKEAVTERWNSVIQSVMTVRKRRYE